MRILTTAPYLLGRFFTFFLLSITADAQTPPQATSQTIPTLEAPDKPQLSTGLLTPEAALPEGFTFRADKLDLNKLLQGETLQIDATGNIRVRTNHGDTITSKKASLDYSKSTPTSIIFTEDVQLKSSNGIEIFADLASLNESQKTITFQNNVAIYQGNAVHRGDQTVYNYESKKIQTQSLRTSFASVLMESQNFDITEGSGGNTYSAQNTGVTTHDARHPNYWLRAKNVSVIPQEKIELKGVKLYAKDHPILWLPNLTISEKGLLNYRPVPGYRSNWGPYLLNSYSQDIGGVKDPKTGFQRDPSHQATWRFDLYGRRGLGLGLDLESSRWESNPNLGGLSLYHIHDFDPSERRSAENRNNFSQTERYHLEFKQRVQTDLFWGATGHADANLTLTSDRFFLEDFRSQSFVSDFQPDNTLSLTQNWGSAHSLTAWTRLRLNNYYQSDQRLPEIAFDQVRRPFFGSPILHESQNSFGIYREDLAEPLADDLRREANNPLTTVARQDEIRDLLAKTGFTRFHTYHELSLPFTLESGLQLTPRIGAGYTRYEGNEGPLSSFGRKQIHASLDASLKFTKRYPNWINRSWGLDSALHILQPYATLTWLKTDELDASFRPIERLSASTRPRALNPGRFASLDELRDWQIVRLGTRNQIVTKRSDSSHQWLAVDTYIDIFTEDPEFDRNVSNLYTDVHWSPLPWLDLAVETQLPLFSQSNFFEIATGLSYMPNPDTEVSLNHRVLKSHPILQDSNRLELQLYNRFNEEWGIGTTHRWEFADNTLESQEYTLYRNLDSWIFSMGLFTRDNFDETEYGFHFGFTLTEFPSLSVPLSVDN